MRKKYIPHVELEALFLLSPGTCNFELLDNQGQVVSDAFLGLCRTHLSSFVWDLFRQFFSYFAAIFHGEIFGVFLRMIMGCRIR